MPNCTECPFCPPVIVDTIGVSHEEYEERQLDRLYGQAICHSQCPEVIAALLAGDIFPGNQDD